jgi:hypothetical protein
MNTNIKFIDIQTPESAFKVDVDELTPLGFECVLDPQTTQGLRDECGRFKVFSIELSLLTPQGRQVVTGECQIHSIRRVSATQAAVCARFTHIGTNGYRWISAHMAMVSLPEQGFRRHST